MSSSKHFIRTSIVLLVLAGCSAPASTRADASASPPLAVDLGPAGRVSPRASEGHEAAPQPMPQLAVAGVGSMAGMNMPGTKSSPVQQAHDGHNDAHGTGTINSVNAAQHSINISHNPIPAIGWPAMTMDFHAAPSVDLSSVKPGEKVNFTIEQGKDGMYEVQAISPASGK